MFKKKIKMSKIIQKTICCVEKKTQTFQNFPKLSKKNPKIVQNFRNLSKIFQKFPKCSKMFPKSCSKPPQEAAKRIPRHTQETPRARQEPQEAAKTLPRRPKIQEASKRPLEPHNGPQEAPKTTKL